MAGDQTPRIPDKQKLNAPQAAGAWEESLEESGRPGASLFPGES